MLKYARYGEASLRLRELDVLWIKINGSPQWDISAPTISEYNTRAQLHSLLKPNSAPTLHKSTKWTLIFLF